MIVLAGPHQRFKGPLDLPHELTPQREAGRHLLREEGFADPALTHEQRNVSEAKPAFDRPLPGRGFQIRKPRPVERR